jgi:myo-inositol-hexaphosphate 3-phosphohydrolase
VPFTVDDTDIWVGKVVEETSSKVETSVRASRALVHDLGGSGLAIVRYTDPFEARVVLFSSHGDNEIVVFVPTTAGNLSDFNIVETKLGPGETFMDSNVSRGTAGNGVVSVTGYARTSVRIGGDVWGKERESEERKRE